MTSACGVVTEVKEDGQEAGKKADQLRAVNQRTESSNHSI